ncbi:hypothetical protein [Candidatus Liberibacter solanacearum]|uniref:hypothetical protein n=1 Tax=Candidatus Liberibacter solanacearum TaxID=556287 RepID=UPI001F0B49F3|nr:hypothetical protein [Candidatus Liberibacter solanacearum]
MSLMVSHSEFQRSQEELGRAMDAGFYRYDPPEKPEYGFWTNIAYDVANIPKELIKGGVEGEVDLFTSPTTALGYYTPDNKIDSKPWYNVDEDAGFASSTAHSIGHFLASFGSSFIASLSNPVTALSALTIGQAGASLASGTRTYKELRDAGADHDTAKKGALITTGATFLGGKVAGVYGKTLASKMATGGATNVAFGLGERQSIGAYLKMQGYEDLAQHYSRLDATSMGAEFIIGAGLGALLHGKGGKHPDIKLSDVDKAQAVKSDIDNMVHSAPGIATSHQSAEIHAQR